MNTRIEYLYRDADNYKSYNEAVLEGEITEEQIAIVKDSLDCDEMFIPSLVGLPGNRFKKMTTADHIWFEFIGFEPTTAAPDIGLTVDEVVKAFAEQKDHWEANVDLATFEMMLSDGEEEEDDWDEDTDFI